MRKTTFIAKLLLLAYVCALILPVTVSAQTATPQPFIHINSVKPVEIVTLQAGVQGLAFETTFTMLDTERNVLAGAEPETGTFILANSSTQAQIQGIAVPWTVAVVVDASANMGNFSASAAYKNARTALADSLGGQQNITFTILKFDDRAPTVMEFNTNQDAIRKAVTDIRAATRGNACMHNAISEAITKLSSTPGRRAVIVFSASIDNCSQITAQQVISQAQQNNVQIYAVGLRGYGITEQALIDITDGTGGLQMLKDEADIGFGFRNMMAMLGGQFSAKGTFFPLAGPQNVQLDVILKNGSQLSSGPIPFTSPQDFIPPPQIELKGVILPRPDGFTFNLDIINPERIRSLKISIIDKLTGRSVTELTENEMKPTYNIVVSGLTLGNEYDVLITAVDESLQPLSQTGGVFKFEPPPLQFGITAIEQPTLENGQFRVVVEPAAPQGVVKFEVVLVSGTDSVPISGMSGTFPAGDPIVLPVKDDSLPAGEYFFVVRAQDGAGKVLAELPSSKFRYEPFTFMDRFVAFAQSSPYALVGITGVCCLAFIALGAVLVVFVWRPNSRVKEVEILVPEKQVRQARPTDSGYFDRSEERPNPPPQQRRQEPPPPPARRAEPAPPVAAPAANMPTASLMAQTPATSMPPTPLRKASLTLGRRNGNDIVLNVDNSSGVSGQHCKIVFNNGKFYVQDDGSTYGTTVNGKTVPKGSPLALEDGAVIGLGPNVKIQFRLGR